MSRLISSCRRLAVVLFACALAPVSSWADGAPSADVLLKGVRRGAMASGEKDITGQLRKRGTKVPFSIGLRGDVICFQYQTGGEWKRFDLKFKEKGQDIQVVEKGQSSRLPVSGYVRPIADTDVTYEDLSMRFLYWPNGKVLPEDGTSTVKGRDCWVVQVANPSPGTGLYKWVRVWIDKENGAMWQIDGIDARGELSKRFLMDSVMKLKDGSWFFKKMKLEVRDPADSRKTNSVSYIEMNASN